MQTHEYKKRSLNEGSYVYIYQFSNVTNNLTHHITMIEFYIHKNDIEIMKSEQK